MQESMVEASTVAQKANAKRPGGLVSRSLEMPVEETAVPVQSRKPRPTRLLMEKKAERIDVAIKPDSWAAA